MSRKDASGLDRIRDKAVAQPAGPPPTMIAEPVNNELRIAVVLRDLTIKKWVFFHRETVT